MRVLLLTNGVPFERRGLSGVRALAGAGASVTVAVNRKRAAVLHSRFTRRSVVVPDANDDARSLVNSLCAYLASHPHHVLLPFSEDGAIAAAHDRARLEKLTAVPVPSRESMDLARDKLELLQLARSLGIEAPVTHAPQSREEAADLARRIRYPCVCKLRRGIGAQGLVWAENAAELLRCFDAAPQPAGLLFDRSRLVQAVAPGELHDVCALFNRGEPRAALTMRRIHMLPPRGGMGVYTETTDEPELREQAIALLRALDWHGPADVEFRLERPGGRAKLIEVNPRFWGGLELAIQAGVNFPMLAARMAVEGDIAPVYHYDVGIRQWWPFPYALRYAREKGVDWQMLRQLLRVPRRLRSDLRVTDPMPHVFDLAGAVRIAIKNRRGRAIDRR